MRTRQQVTLVHKQGCPQRPERVERYEAPRADGKPVYVTRCQDCGEMHYADTPPLPVSLPGAA